MSVGIDQICTFRIGDHRMALRLSHVREALHQQDVTPIPRTPPAVSGLSSLRGRIVTAVDLRTRLGLEPIQEPESAFSLVVENGDSLYMLLVDELGDIVDAPDERTDSVPENLESPLREMVDAVLEDASEWILVVDLEAALAVEI